MPPRKKKEETPKKVEKKEDVEEENEEESMEDEKPKGRKRAAPTSKKPTPKKSKKKGEEDAEGEGEGEGETEAGSTETGDKVNLNTSMPSSFSYESTEQGKFKIVSYNVDGLSSAMKKNFKDYVIAESADVICIQETKMNEDNYPKKMFDIYPYETWSCCKTKKGYSGTAILSKTKPLSIQEGIGHAEHDQEGRSITYEFEHFYLVNCYVPNSGQKLERLDYRATWDTALRQYLIDLDKKKPIILTGDLNVAHTEIDLTNPKTNKNTAGYTQQERDYFTELLEKGNFVDSFRELNPGKTNQFSFWGKRFNARGKNIGWRLDYFVVSQRFMKSNVQDTFMRREVWGASDHVPICLILKDVS